MSIGLAKGLPWFEVPSKENWYYECIFSLGKVSEDVECLCLIRGGEVRGWERGSGIYIVSELYRQCLIKPTNVPPILFNKSSNIPNVKYLQLFMGYPIILQEPSLSIPITGSTTDNFAKYCTRSILTKISVNLIMSHNWGLTLHTVQCTVDTEWCAGINSSS